MSLRTRITVTYIGLTVVAILLASTFSSWQLNSYLDKRQAASLESEVRSLALQFERGSLYIDSTSTNDAFLKQVSRELGVRLTAVRKDGTVCFDTDVPFDSLAHVGNHAERPEIVRARQGDTGVDRRKSATVGEEFLYVARRLRGSSLGGLDSGYVRLAFSVREIQTLDNQVQALIWGMGLLAVIIIAGVSYQVSKQITKPIQTIVNRAQAVKNGDFGQRIDVRSNDEIGLLATSINEMAEKLGSDIERLNKLERVRSEFLANVSHELRTPIFSIQGFLETLLDGAVDDPGVNKEFLEKAHKHASRLNALLNDLIDISRIESGDMKMSFRYFGIAEFVRQVVDELRPQAEKKQISLTFHSGVEAAAQVYGDRDRLKQVLINLIDNGIKYTESGGSVRCSVEGDGDRCVVSVSDTGTGIPPEHTGRIFERFYRVDRDRSRQVGGTGLGLAIVKHIVEAHGSSVSVQSTVGKGSTFSFALKR